METLNPNYSTTRFCYKLVDDSYLDEIGKIKEDLKFKINNPAFNIQHSKFKTSTEDKFETVLFLPAGEGRTGEGGLRTKGYFKFSYEGLIMNDGCLILKDEFNNEHTLSDPTSDIQNLSLTKLPLITVITVVYNGVKYLEETIQSVINQTYPNVEYIIIDGGSTDGTVDIIKKYEDCIDYWVSEKDKGIYDAMNKGLTLCSGRIIGIINADDSYVKDIFWDVLKYFEESDIVVLCGNIDYVDKDKTFIREMTSNINKIYYRMSICHPSVFISSSAYKADSFDTRYNIAADYDLLLRLRIKKYKFYYLNKTIVRMRIGGLSYIYKELGEEEQLKIIRENFKDSKIKYFLALCIRKIVRILGVLNISTFIISTIKYIP